jgi:hypothetical protein
LTDYVIGKMRYLIWIICTLLLSLSLTVSAAKLVKGVEVSALGQLADDEEAPFEIVANNKVHKCGGKSSNRFLIYSEDPDVAMRRFLLALEAMRNDWVLTLNTEGCEGSALRAFEIRLHR